MGREKMIFTNILKSLNCLYIVFQQINISENPCFFGEKEEEEGFGNYEVP
jgi:hypothetical protein